jgi:hypothetical protein
MAILSVERNRPFVISEHLGLVSKRAKQICRRQQLVVQEVGVEEALPFHLPVEGAEGVELPFLPAVVGEEELEELMILLEVLEEEAVVVAVVPPELNDQEAGEVVVELKERKGQSDLEEVEVVGLQMSDVIE